MLVTSDLIAEARARYAAENSLYEFTKQAWEHSVSISSPYIDNWHIAAICEHLEALHRRDIRRLIINLPPRCGKSSIISVFLPAWVFIHRPDEEFFYASYAHSLALRDSVACRRLIQSDWYQNRWGHLYKLRKDQNSKIRFDTDKNGYRASTGLSGSLTGFGGSFNVLDDPNNVSEGESDAVRNSTNDTVSAAWSTRSNNPKRSVKLLVSQRIHELDVSGYIMKNDIDKEWVRCILPMEFEEARKSRTIILPSTNKKVWEDPRTKEGELLWPELYGPKEVRTLKNDLGSEYRIAGQLQQRPAPTEGGLLKRTWFQWWKESKPPQLLQIVQSWDTALEAKKSSCYSACTTWGIFHDKFGITNLILLSMYRGKIEMPELVEMAKRLYKDYRDDGESDIIPDGYHVPDLVLIEAKANGISLIQTLRRMGIATSRVDPKKYGGDKELRVKLISHLVQSGRVWVPARGPDYIKLKKYAEVFIENCVMFPAGESADLVDSFTQVLHRLKNEGIITHPADEDFDESHNTDKAGHGYW